MKPPTHQAPLVAVALSGGRDSALVASILRNRGASLTSYTLWLTPLQETGAAATIAEALGIPNHVVDAREDFEREVVEHTVRHYRRALTPNPCVICNASVKFPTVLGHALRDGAVCVATGHYARVRRGRRMSILRARDRTRDQSYFLCSLRQRTLRRVRFPLGELTTKSRARRHNAFELLDHCLSPSRDACFLGIGGLPELLRERLGPLSEGSIVDSTGTLLGSHRGAALYTVGQRKGLGIGGGPWYVLGTDVRRNVVTVGTASEAHRRCLGVGRLNWVSASPQRSDFRAQVQIRSSHRAASAVICPTSATRAVVEFDTPQFGIAPGQFAVLYDGDLLLAGGRILPVR